MKVIAALFILLFSFSLLGQQSSTTFGLNGNVLLSNRITKIEDLANPLLSYGGGVYLNLPINHSDNLSIGSEFNYYSRALFAESKPVSLKNASARLNFLEAYPYIKVTKVFDNGTLLSLSSGPTINHYLSGKINLVDTLGKSSSNNIDQSEFGDVVIGFQSIISVNFNPLLIQLKYNSLRFGINDSVSNISFVQPNIQIGLLVDLRFISF